MTLDKSLLFPRPQLAHLYIVAAGSPSRSLQQFARGLPEPLSYSAYPRATNALALKSPPEADDLTHVEEGPASKHLEAPPDPSALDLLGFVGDIDVIGWLPAFVQDEKLGVELEEIQKAEEKGVATGTGQRPVVTGKSRKSTKLLMTSLCLCVLIYELSVRPSFIEFLR